MEARPSQPIKGLIDGIAVIQELTYSDRPVSTTELSQKLMLEKTHVNRILKTLAYIGLVFRTKQRKYIPGAGIHALAAQTLHASGLLQKALPILEELQKYQLIVALGVLWNQNVSYLYHWEPGISNYQALGRLASYPVTESSIGHVLLSQYEREEIEQKINSFPNVQSEDNQKLITQIMLAKVRGYGEVRRENLSIGVKIGNPAFSAIAFSGKIAEMDEAELITILRIAAEKIEKAMVAK